VRLASIATPDGPRLHVRARSGYVDAAEATGNPRLSSLQYLLESVPSAMDALRPLQDVEGRPVEEADFAPAVPAPRRILCLGLNYGELALEGGPVRAH
jgi:2-keto-4-pentenoate hydratase/2-oxohepta-3-ene-1,7-dioic acid hydratase in catechol pathway